MATKRKHNEVTLKGKYEALKELENGRTNNENSSLKRQRVKTGTYEKLNEALLKWFKSMRGNNIPINGPILLEKAHEFAKAFDYKDFTASNGWLRAWKERLETFC